ncbi:alpha/beta fold hydrolase [Roseospira visakhapatnamensis]|uniref:Pimeloyl-ACP methyl ester carboxylesterase n=1 Tax=Roseospira visakhapatnamensis TaxID=390880 RepID=A0A7W6RDY0_9PROT|nr:alpha/beta hydrolase [Roseospira visakhapatnamensis]MBB4266249.1 pimeloyl-ACP methyl ester carboxylesterase [Roseospira visakhapatnamensis]
MPTMRTADGADLFYQERGQGRPLIMMPGWGCSHRFFDRNVEDLARVCRVITPDLRAHGDSSDVAWGHRIARYAADMKALIDVLELEGVVLLGWSMGAAVAWSYVDLFGTAHLAGHVSVDQSPRQYYSETWRWGQPGCYDAEALAILSTRLEYDAPAVARGLVRGCLGDVYQATDAEIETLAREIDKCPPAVRAEIMADHTHLDWRDLLPRIDLPALVCVGRQSKVFPWQGSAYVGERIPGARTVVFEQSGHMPFYEEASAFNAAVADFVMGLDTAVG